MKIIAVSASKKSLDGLVGGVFGRARFFILADPETGEWEALDNLSDLFARQQIGVTTAQTIIRKNIRTVMTEKCGAKAFEKLQAAGVQVCLDTKGSVRQALERLIRGEVVPATCPNIRKAH
jgi:predicted Fe-Mo cluster-binding NifX family protein